VKLFGRAKATDHDGVEGSAVVVASSLLEATDEHAGKNNDYTTLLGTFNLGVVPHDLTLEVHVVGRESFTVDKRERVPARAAGNRWQLPVGIELPVRVSSGTADGVDIQWAQFLDAPDRKREVDNAAARESAAEVRRSVEAVPGMQAQTWAAAAMGMPLWMNAVRTGSMTRKEFDQQVDGLTRIGQMDPELAAQGKATLSTEGFSG
jgi:hypothetical protein